MNRFKLKSKKGKGTFFKIFLIMITLALISIIAGFYLAGGFKEGSVPTFSYRVIASYPHDSLAFTEGLVYDNGNIYEGTGLIGQSSLRQLELETGKILKISYLEDGFGEGITIENEKIIQLTWRSRIGYVYEISNFSILQNFTYATEGWGITYDGNRLIMSDGTSSLYFMDPTTYTIIGQIQVRDNKGPVDRLNELEYVNGEIYANVWQTNRIAKISPYTGLVSGWIDLSGLLSPQEQAGADVLNGIAYDELNGRLFVTGKYWPKLFQIEIEQH